LRLASFGDPGLDFRVCEPARAKGEAKVFYHNPKNKDLTPRVGGWYNKINSF
jgi:hypothetical protein